MSCPDENALLAFVHRRSTEDERASVEAHVRHCESCQLIVGFVAKEGALAAPPPELGTGSLGPTLVKTPPTVLEAGAPIGRYVVMRRLGAGGMGVVYAAHDPSLARTVAVKVLRAEVADADASAGRARLIREAQTMAKLSHPNVVAVHDVGSHGDEVFVAMEYVDGVTLTQWLKLPRTNEQVLDMFRQAGQGLWAAHQAGLVHRDFKPANVLVATDGRARVTDFGLARSDSEGRERETSTPATPAFAIDAAITEPHQLTRTGLLLGTPAYMAPEQMRGERTDARTDQFAFCVALYEALYGTRPFIGSTLVSIYGAVVAGTIEAPKSKRRVPQHVHRALLTGLSADPRERHSTMAALLTKLTAAERARWPVALGAVAAVAAFSAGTIAWVKARPDETGGRPTGPEATASTGAVATGAVPPAAGPSGAVPTTAVPTGVVPTSDPPSTVATRTTEPAPARPKAARPAASPKVPRPTAAAKETGDGVLTLHVSPWGEVAVDGRTVPSANFMDYVIAVAPGTHRVEVKHPQLGKRSETVNIEPGKTLHRNLTLK